MPLRASGMTFVNGPSPPRVDGSTSAAPLSRRPKIPKKAVMPIRLDRDSADFDQRFAALLAAKREVSADVEKATRAIVDDVAARGDAALLEATRKFDRLDIDARGLRITPAEIEGAVKACDPNTIQALALARDRIDAFHRRQMPPHNVHFVDHRAAADQRAVDSL